VAIQIGKDLQGGKITIHHMKTKLKKKYNEAIELLRRWSDADVPDNIWCQPGEDYMLPLDTQIFLKDVEEDEKQLHK